MHAGKDRIVLGAQPEHPRDAELFPLQAVAGIGVLGPAAYRLHRHDVPAVMHKPQVYVGARGRSDHRHTGLIPQPELSRKPHRQLRTYRCHRMAWPEMRLNQPLIPGHMQGAGHLPPASRPPLAIVRNAPDDGAVHVGGHPWPGPALARRILGHRPHGAMDSGSCHRRDLGSVFRTIKIAMPKLVVYPAATINVRTEPVLDQRGPRWQP